MKMKHIFIVIVLAACLLVLTGCGYARRITAASEAFSADNPAATQIPVDEDGDTIPDFLGVDADNDGKVDTDPFGKPVEVPGTRSGYAAAGDFDDSMGELCLVLGTVFGLPGVGGLVGSWWGRRKPTKQLTALVQSFEKAKASKTPKGMITVSKAALELYLRESPGLVDLLDDIRAKDKAIRKAAQE